LSPGWRTESAVHSVQAGVGSHLGLGIIEVQEINKYLKNKITKEQKEYKR